jgi:hypothetical protein
MAIWDAQTSADQGEISGENVITNFISSVDAQGVPTTGATTLSGYIYRLKFYGNPGAFKQPEIELYLDGARPSIVSATDKKIITKVWTDGQQGEDYDHFADHCDGVTVNVAKTGKVHYLTSMTTVEKNLLKTCLGSSDFNTDNNVEVYNWDYGSKNYPHIIKLVRTVRLGLVLRI